MSLSVLWRILYCVWIVSEICIGIATRTRKSSGNVHDRGTMLLLWIVLFSAITAGIWVSEAAGSNLPGGARWLRPASVLVMIFGLGLRWSAILSLGQVLQLKRSHPRHAKGAQNGPLFRWMRHPSYTGLLLCISGGRLCIPATGYRF
jgi:protein-S-isoprenylcysteine O-methyltransferase